MATICSRSSHGFSSGWAGDGGPCQSGLNGSSPRSRASSMAASYTSATF
ncbi:hypothetical protein FM110_06075 [Brachybacterium nesterenkovii]|uniref:Uncharacterized protein n=1 Tax=Brachybacterium nesterenkovii TaxID=47847 RepID=A0A1X6WYK6_9MICO|nr:hypothetical protein FM110_06075 [Brachybacterium nesterenkovii]